MQLQDVRGRGEKFNIVRSTTLFCFGRINFDAVDNTNF